MMLKSDSTVSFASVSPGGHHSGPLTAGNQVSERVFSEVRDLAYRTAGIDLQEGKREMVAARLWKQARVLGYSSAEEYFEAVKKDSSGDLVSDLIDALTTNFTSFFREPAHFDFFRGVIIPELKRRGSPFHIWTAASATGEEPYSIAITLYDEFGGNLGGRGKLIASDISSRALRKAIAGVYPEDRFRGLEADWKRKYLLRGKGDQSGNYRIRPEVRRLVEFNRVNLMEPLPAFGPFALIWLRNIMIYFDRPTQQKVVQALTQKLEPGGYLFVGHSESLNGIEHSLEHVQVAVYRKPAGSGQR